MFSTFSGRAWVDDNSCSSPPRRLKLTSTMRMLLEDTSSCGRPPDSRLFDRSRRSNPVIPSHWQQSEPLFHDTARPPSCESPPRNWRREPFSCSVQELVGEAKHISSTRPRPREVSLNKSNLYPHPLPFGEQEKPCFEKTVGKDMQSIQPARWCMGRSFPKGACDPEQTSASQSVCGQTQVDGKKKCNHVA
ncbi:hypothetical protein VPH35_103760 [Triticum aestivum]